MPTILELFRGSDFDKAVDSKAKEGKGTLFAQIKSFGEQELTGIRVKSAVELNNPLIYGNEATRIALRSTPLKDKQLDTRRDTGGATGANEGGLIGKGLDKITGGNITSLSGLRDKVNEKLGVPQSPIPSRYYTQLGGAEQITQYPELINEIKANGEGKGIGKFLSGGNPKAIAKQAAGDLLQQAKKELRNTLFGKSSEPAPNPLKSKEPKIYDRGDASYTKQNDSFQEAGSTDSASPAIDTSDKQNPTIYKSPGDVVASFRVGKNALPKITKGNYQDGKTTFTKENYNEDIVNKRDKRFKDSKNELLSLDGKGFTNKDDVINQSGIYDGGTDAETNVLYELNKKDFIPLYFRNIVTGETVHFRGTITGLSETVSPSWDSAKFAGNPFNFYTYGGIERNVSFNFIIYPMNSAELVNNWSKIEFLTSLTYPLGYQSGDIGSVRAPIIYFTMGDLYKDRVSFIESLQYTIPDNSNWQLDGTQKDYESSGAFFDKVGASKTSVDKDYKLPHLIEVAITLKFLEQRNNTEDRTKLYSFKSITY
jgi:hypothetical protein